VSPHGLAVLADEAALFPVAGQRPLREPERGALRRVGVLGVRELGERESAKRLVRVAEHLLERGVGRLQPPVPVDDRDPDRGLLEDRAEARLAGPQGLLGAAPLDHAPELRTDVAHQAQERFVRLVRLGREELEHTGDLAPDQHGEPERGPESRLPRLGRARQLLGPGVGQPHRPALGEDAARDPGPDAHPRRLGGRPEGGEDPRGLVVPDPRRAELAGSFVGDVRMTDRPAGVLADRVEADLKGAFDGRGLVGRHRRELEQLDRGRLLPQVLGLLRQLPVAELDRARHPSEDRKEQGVDRQEGEAERGRDRHDVAPDLLGDRAVVLVDLQDARRAGAVGQPHRHIGLEHLLRRLAGDRIEVGHLELGLAPERAQDLGVRRVARADQPAHVGVGHPSIRAPELDPHGARPLHEDQTGEDLVQGLEPRARRRGREVGRPESVAQDGVHDRARAEAHGVLGALGRVVLQEPHDRGGRQRERDGRVDREAQDERGRHGLPALRPAVRARPPTVGAAVHGLDCRKEAHTGAIGAADGVFSPGTRLARRRFVALSPARRPLVVRLVNKVQGRCALRGASFSPATITTH
jgi:hypothetical protein